ncbi:MAG: hypothetical protein N4A33_10550 [Bacteriovoracaceae bacterium]|jgi:hypothetical protein|nr:hypothetical protein [Bacteriovoracaceae bacterium]
MKKMILLLVSSTLSLASLAQEGFGGRGGGECGATLPQLSTVQSVFQQVDTMAASGKNTLHDANQNTFGETLADGTVQAVASINNNFSVLQSGAVMAVADTAPFASSAPSMWQSMALNQYQLATGFAINQFTPVISNPPAGFVYTAAMIEKWFKALDAENAYNAIAKIPSVRIMLKEQLPVAVATALNTSGKKCNQFLYNELATSNKLNCISYGAAPLLVQGVSLHTSMAATAKAFSGRLIQEFVARNRISLAPNFAKLAAQLNGLHQQKRKTITQSISEDYIIFYKQSGSDNVKCAVRSGDAFAEVANLFEYNNNSYMEVTNNKICKRTFAMINSRADLPAVNVIQNITTGSVSSSSPTSAFNLAQAHAQISNYATVSEPMVGAVQPSMGLVNQDALVHLQARTIASASIPAPVAACGVGGSSGGNNTGNTGINTGTLNQNTANLGANTAGFL